MKPDHIPILSYVFIGVTSLVLTYATIMDTTNEVIIVPTTEPESSYGSMIPSVSLPEVSLPSFDETIDKIKSVNPFASALDSNEVAPQPQPQIPVAVPVNTPSAPPLPVAGGNRRTKHKKHNKSPKNKHNMQNKIKNTRRIKKLT